MITNKTLKFLKWIPLLFIIIFSVTLICLVPCISQANENDDSNKNINLADYKACKINNVDPTPISELPTTPGNYILSQDINITETWTVSYDPINGEVVTSIDLNGHNITLETSEHKTVIYIPNSGDEEKVVTLNIFDFDEENPGIISGGTGYENTESEVTYYAGGGIYNTSLLNLYGGVIANNSADKGGGIYSAGVTNIYGGQISNNTADNGAGVYALSMITSTAGTICDNIASSTGGGLSCGALTKLENTKVLRNTACNGAGIYSFAATIFLTNLTVDNNKAITSESSNPLTLNNGESEEDFNGSGGGLFAFMTNSVILGGSFTNNTSEESGGGIFQTAILTTSISDSLIDNNTAKFYGGGIYMFSVLSDILVPPYNLTNLQITNNEANEGGGIFTYGSSIYCDTCNIQGNKANYMGGGANTYLQFFGHSIFENSTIKNNSAAVGAGFGSTLCQAQFDNCEITNNETFDGDEELSNVGGGLFAISGDLSAKNTNINNNTSYYGAGLAFLGGTLNIEGGQISENHAAFFSGAIATTCTSTFKSITINNNSANTFCGGLFASAIPILNSNTYDNSNDYEIFTSTIDGCKIFDNEGEGLVMQCQKNILDGNLKINNNTTKHSCFNDAPNVEHNSNLLLLKNNNASFEFEPFIEIGASFNHDENIGFNIGGIENSSLANFKLKHLSERLTNNYNPSGQGLVYKDFSYEGYEGMAIWGDQEITDTNENTEIWVNRNHKHNWNFDYQSDSFLAWCDDPDCEHHNKETAIKTLISAENATYDGKPHPANFNKDFYLYTWTTPKNILYNDLNIDNSPFVEDEPIEAGNYIATIQINNSLLNPHSISCNYEIRRNALEPEMVHANQLEFEYDGTEKQPSFSIYDGSWYLNDSLNFYGDLQATEPGDYQIIVSQISNKSNSLGAYSGSLTINWKISGSPSPIPDPVNPGTDVTNTPSNTGDLTDISTIMLLIALLYLGTTILTYKKQLNNK